MTNALFFFFFFDGTHALFWYTSFLTPKKKKKIYLEKFWGLTSQLFKDLKCATQTTCRLLDVNVARLHIGILCGSQVTDLVNTKILWAHIFFFFFFFFFFFICAHVIHYPNFLFFCQNHIRFQILPIYFHSNQFELKPNKEGKNGFGPESETTVKTLTNVKFLLLLLFFFSFFFFSCL